MCCAAFFITAIIAYRGNFRVKNFAKNISVSFLISVSYVRIRKLHETVWYVKEEMVWD